jgi:hypothetical protein
MCWIGIHRMGRYLWTDVPAKVSRIYNHGPWETYQNSEVSVFISFSVISSPNSLYESS